MEGEAGSMGKKVDGLGWVGEVQDLEERLLTEKERWQRGGEEGT